MTLIEIKVCFSNLDSQTPQAGFKKTSNVRPYIKNIVLPLDISVYNFALELVY